MRLNLADTLIMRHRTGIAEILKPEGSILLEGEVNNPGHYTRTPVAGNKRQNGHEGLKYYASGIYHQSYIRAVDGVTLDIGRGETLAVIGGSGCGKSTLGKCMLRLVEPSSGSIRFDGVNILNLSQVELRAHRHMEVAACRQIGEFGNASHNGSET